MAWAAECLLVEWAAWEWKNKLFLEKNYLYPDKYNILMEEEYELVPMNPIRRIEKRMERIEAAGTGTDVIKELIDVVRTNQQVVDNVVRINSEMISRVSELSSSVNELTKKINDFMNRVEITGESEATEEKEEKSLDKERLEKLERRINSMIMSMAKPRFAAPLQPRKILPQKPLAA